MRRRVRVTQLQAIGQCERKRKNAHHRLPYEACVVQGRHPRELPVALVVHADPPRPVTRSPREQHSVPRVGSARDAEESEPEPNSGSDVVAGLARHEVADEREGNHQRPAAERHDEPGDHDAPHQEDAIFRISIRPRATVHRGREARTERRRRTHDREAVDGLRDREVHRPPRLRAYRHG